MNLFSGTLLGLALTGSGMAAAMPQETTYSCGDHWVSYTITLASDSSAGSVMISGEGVDGSILQGVVTQRSESAVGVALVGGSTISLSSAGAASDLWYGSIINADGQEFDLGICR